MRNVLLTLEKARYLKLNDGLRMNTVMHPDDIAPSLLTQELQSTGLLPICYLPLDSFFMRDA